MRPLSLALAGLAALAFAPAAHATFPGQNGRIAYGVEGTDYRALVTVEADSRGDRFLRECVEGDETDMGDCSSRYRAPAWSADGRRLVFDAGRSLALISRNGSGFEALDAHTGNDGEPAFSRSGRQLVFSGRAQGRRSIFVRDLRSDRVRRIATGATPDWSKRGTIAFVRRGTIFSVHPGRGRARRVLRGRDPSWSGSGRSLAFSRRGGIYLARADGTGARRIVRCSGCGQPALSPDGRLVAYEDGGVLVARVSDGRRVSTLAENAGDGFRAFEPAWQSK